MQSNKLFYGSVTPLLLEILNKIMESSAFDNFRLVGGTALSLQIGHRKSADIDLFTDAEYNSIDFTVIDKQLHDFYPYVDTNEYHITGMGKSYYVGNHKDDCIKIDICYSDPYIEEFIIVDKIRMATLRDITAMKIDIISRGGRKKDFWDIHELANHFSLQQMLDFHKLRYPFSHNTDKILEKLTDFNQADSDFDPVCLKGKYWELIKLDLIEWIS